MSQQNRRSQAATKKPAVHLVGPDAQVATLLAPDMDDDRRWFAKHPLAQSRERLASSRELLAEGLPANAVVDVVVLRTRDGRLARVMLEPVRYDR